jgi:hypothetical protein
MNGAGETKTHCHISLVEKLEPKEIHEELVTMFGDNAYGYSKSKPGFES